MFPDDIWGAQVGAPYVMHPADARALLPLWRELMPRVFHEYPNVDGPNKDPTRHYAEMYGYVMAAAHLGLPHRLVHGLMVGCMVGWGAIDKLVVPPDHRCGVDDVATLAVRGDAGGDGGGPALVHYCQRHAIAGWWVAPRGCVSRCVAVSASSARRRVARTRRVAYASCRSSLADESSSRAPGGALVTQRPR